MKKNVLKYIRTAANKLPPKTETVLTTERFTEEEIQAAHEKYSPDNTKPLPVHGTRAVKTARVRDVNHEHKMKQLYKTGGLAAVERYIAQNG